MAIDYDYISIEGYLVKQIKKRSPHHLQPICKGIPYQYCINCGLVALHNKASQKALKEGCIEYTDVVVGKVGRK